MRRRRLRRLAIGCIAAAACAIWFLYFAPLPRELAEPKPLTGIYLDAHGKLIAELASDEARSHRPIPLNAMGPWLPAITVALEDQRFYSHRGIDLRATARALFRRHGGGSTITQQLVKIATRRTKRSVFAKAREALIALQLETRWSKAQILAAYLNRIPYGNRMIGAEAAAQAYFDKPASELNKAEATFLAGIPRKPSRLNPWSHAAAAARQFERSRQALLARGALQMEEAAELRLPNVTRHLPENVAPHFVQIVSRRGLRGEIRCTLDLDLQRRAVQLVREHLTLLRRPDIAEAAMVVLENKTGAVRALVGSRDFARNQINGALRYRDCGSTLKPFLYATGIDRRIFTAATLLPDTPDAARDAYADYDPHNFVLSHLGPVRVREALGNSLNVPAVVAVSRIGAREAFDGIGAWGVRFDRPLEKTGAGFILGNVGVRLLDLAGAYAGLARGGFASAPTFLQNETAPLRRVVSADAAAIISDILCDHAARLHSFGPHSVLNFPVRVGAKTGTSTGFRDAWALGFSREHTVGVWVGNREGQPMDQAAAIASAAPLWRRMMDDLLQTDQPVPESRLPRISVCGLTGLRPAKASARVIGELFLPGTEPREKADAWFAPDGHPLLPEEYAAWCASADNHLAATIRPDAEKLAILTPRDGAVFVLDPFLPIRQQQLEFQASLADGVSWKINGKPLATQSDGRVTWPLQEGEWTIEAAERDARLTSMFRVQRP